MLNKLFSFFYLKKNYFPAANIFKIQARNEMGDGRVISRAKFEESCHVKKRISKYRPCNSRSKTVFLFIKRKPFCLISLTVLIT